MNIQQLIPRAAPQELDAGTALGLLLAYALQHAAEAQQCCPRCCWACRALDFYRQDIPFIADHAVSSVLGSRTDWNHPDGTINWDAITVGWPADGEHLPSCPEALNQA